MFNQIHPIYLIQERIASFHRKPLHHFYYILQSGALWACMSQNDWPESLHCVHFHTPYQRRLIKKLYSIAQIKISMKQLQMCPFFLLFHWFLVCQGWTNLFCVPVWHHPVGLLWIQTVQYIGQTTWHAKKKACGYSQQTLQLCQQWQDCRARACIHLNFLMHPPSAANGKYHCKSLRLPRATEGLQWARIAPVNFYPALHSEDSMAYTTVKGN